MLVLARDRRVHDALARLLAAAGHTVDDSSTAGAVVVVDLATSRDAEGVSSIRSFADKGHAVVALGSTTAAREAALAAGARHFLDRENSAVDLVDAVRSSSAGPDASSSATRRFR